tara:strand:- start:615 stop:2231 length:1617 start_codon:yes stop_codon:yes gene_type:complete
MDEIFLYKGNLLDIIKSNSTSSIKGVLNPQEISLSNFLFLDYDFESFKKLYNYYNKDKFSEYDQLPFYFGLSYIAIKDRLDGELDNFNLESEFKKLPFKNKSYKNILKHILNFIDKPSMDIINKINKLDLDKNTILLALSFCFKYSNKKFIDYLDFFPELSSCFILNDDGAIKIISDENFSLYIKENGLFTIFIINKFYDIIDKEDINFILKTMFDNRIFDSFTLHKYLSVFFNNSNVIQKLHSLIDEYNEYIDKKIILGISHYINLFNYLSNDFNRSITWYNQFYSKIKDGSIKSDFDGFIDWDLNKNDFDPVIYSSYQENSRFYLNSIPALIQSRKDLTNQKDPVKFKNNSKKINVIGGIQSLGWCNIYNINHSFHYVNRYSPKTTPFIFNDSDFAFLKEEESTNLFVLDIEMFIDQNIKVSLKDIFSEIDPICNFSNIYFLTILKPSLLSHNHLKYEKIIKKIDDFNSELNNLISEFQFNIIDTSSYIMETNTGENLRKNQQQKATIYTNNDNLLCNYYIKPDIILEILDNELSE